ncbi:Rha family transcriptional regulator [Lacticaseibacillus pabuli]|uniref:Rha family transcriptional regulator n=1 Tax=Lacticaseibacillus pabuli TaxID=3025672 RepID=A0ABY7WWT9_9LACO|nr:Rha family transcriptional regulator [Lacticaseibacillus sp. KACC 23028]WDF83600.1 Rha family transcriptional regulator [Lacticaseibacillus sp. KACC 23028]
MANLVIMHDQQAVTTSLQLAETFGKNHKHVLDSIENLVAEKSAAKFFAKDTYTSRGKQYPLYYMTRDGFTLLAMGFTGKAALEFKLQYIDAFNSMEQTIKRVPEKRLDPVQQAELNATRAKTAKANALYKIAVKTNSQTSQQYLLAKAAEAILGEMTIPALPNKEYSATEVGKRYGVSANRVGRIAKAAGIKAEQPGQNDYGRWANSKSRNSNKEVPQWLYTEAGAVEVGKHVKEGVQQ